MTFSFSLFNYYLLFLCLLFTEIQPTDPVEKPNLTNQPEDRQENVVVTEAGESLLYFSSKELGFELALHVDPRETFHVVQGCGALILGP